MLITAVQVTGVIAVPVEGSGVDEGMTYGICRIMGEKSKHIPGQAGGHTIGCVGRGGIVRRGGRSSIVRRGGVSGPVSGWDKLPAAAHQRLKKFSGAGGMDQAAQLGGPGDIAGGEEGEEEDVRPLSTGQKCRYVRTFRHAGCGHGGIPHTRDRHVGITRSVRNRLTQRISLYYGFHGIACDALVDI